MGENLTFLTYGDTIANDGVGMNLRTFANHGTITNHSEGSDKDILTNSSCLRDAGQGVDTFLGGFVDS